MTNNTPIPSAHTGHLPFEPEMVPVPAGPFLMGTSDEQIDDMVAGFEWAKEYKEKGWFDNEQPQHELTLPAYEIGRYPVTNAEYAAFVKATGHGVPRHWRDGRFREELADHPVVLVLWHEARAYASWLSERAGKVYRLPTEAEWEKAARGDDARLWPWGNDWDPARANCCADGWGTTPVGDHSPAGDSPCGCADNAGNVWEWTLSLRRAYPYQSDDGRNDPESRGWRVVRGGSWTSDAGPARCSYRRGFPTLCLHPSIGFRLVSLALNSELLIPGR